MRLFIMHLGAPCSVVDVRVKNLEYVFREVP
jgi:hypothetical protein